MYTVYTITDKVTSEVIYVGSTGNLSVRKQKYLCNTNLSHYVVRYMRQYDDWMTRFVFDEREWYMTRSDVLQGEEKLIEKLIPRCNINLNPLYITETPEEVPEVVLPISVSSDKSVSSPDRSALPPPEKESVESEDLRVVFRRLLKRKQRTRN